MALALHKLSDAYVKSKRLNPDRHSDGGGLYLSVSNNGAKSWLFMWSVAITRADGSRGQKRHEMGLGSYPLIPLAEARKVAAQHRETVAQGGKEPGRLGLSTDRSERTSRFPETRSASNRDRAPNGQVT